MRGRLPEAAFWAPRPWEDTKAALWLLADSARLVNDAGGVYHAARKIILGPDRIVRFYLGPLKKLWNRPDELRTRTFNGLPAVEMFYRHSMGRYAPHLVTGILLDGSDRRRDYLMARSRLGKLLHLNAATR